MLIASPTVRRPARPLRWFLLAWECLVFVTGLLSIYGVDLVLSDQRLLCGPVSVAGCAPALAALLHAHLGLAGAFSGLMLVHAALLWRGLSGTLPPHVFAPYFLVQAGLVWALVLIVGQASVTLSLCLALAVGATGMLTEVRAISIVATGYLLLALVSTMWALQAWQNWNVFLIIFWFKSGDAALLLFAAGYVLLYVQQIHAQAQLAATHVQLAASHAHLQASAARIEDLTLLTERQRLARELHDTLSQGVAGLIMQLEAANAQLAQQRQALAQEILRQSLSSARSTLAEARSVIDDLRALPERANLIGAVQDELHRFRSATGLPCAADLGALTLLPLAQHEPVVRAVREGLANVARHAQAHQVWLRVVPEAEALAIEVQDDGIGFAPVRTTQPGGHYGLLGLRERATLAGGTLEVISRPGAGTTLRLCLPRQDREAPR